MNNITIEPMDEEDIEDFITQSDLMAKLLGFKDADDMGDFKVDAAEGMIKFGGGFTHFLGHALARADSKNTAKVIKAFKNDCEHHAALYRKFLRDRHIAKEE